MLQALLFERGSRSWVGPDAYVVPESDIGKERELCALRGLRGELCAAFVDPSEAEEWLAFARHLVNSQRLWALRE